MDRLAWENQLQRHRDMLRKAESANERHAGVIAKLAQHDNPRLPIFRGLILWLRKRLPTRYNHWQETAPTIAQADLPLR